MAKKTTMEWTVYASALFPQMHHRTNRLKNRTRKSKNIMDICNQIESEARARPLQAEPSMLVSASQDLRDCLSLKQAERSDGGLEINHSEIDHSRVPGQSRHVVHLNTVSYKYCCKRNQIVRWELLEQVHAPEL